MYAPKLAVYESVQHAKLHLHKSINRLNQDRLRSKVSVRFSYKLCSIYKMYGATVLLPQRKILSEFTKRLKMSYLHYIYKYLIILWLDFAYVTKVWPLLCMSLNSVVFEIDGFAICTKLSKFLEILRFLSIKVKLYLSKISSLFEDYLTVLIIGENSYLCR